MGYGKINPAVVDAGPIIHLNEIGILHYLEMFSLLHIPKAVLSETVGQGHLSIVDLNKLDNLSKHEVDSINMGNFITENGLDRLDFGEKECLYLCSNIKVPIILTDDLAVRSAAWQLNILPVGSLGIVVKAFHLGLIRFKEAEDKLYELYKESSLFVTKTIIDIAIGKLAESDKSTERVD